MKWAAVLGIATILVIITLREWPKLRPEMKREKAAFAILTILDGTLAFLLVFYPDLPGPTQGLDAMTKPLVKFFGNLMAEWSG